MSPISFLWDHFQVCLHVDSVSLLSFTWSLSHFACFSLWSWYVCVLFQMKCILRSWRARLWVRSWTWPSTTWQHCRCFPAVCTSTSTLLCCFPPFHSVSLADRLLNTGQPLYYMYFFLPKGKTLLPHLYLQCFLILTEDPVLSVIKT